MKSVQARLDEESEDALETLVKRNGWSPSQAVRESLIHMVKHGISTPRRRIIGVGIAASGIGDLSTNPIHMEGFGE
jgi:hypothetical protein